MQSIQCTPLLDKGTPARQKFSLNGHTRVHDDECGVNTYYKQSAGPGSYILSNMTPCDKTVAHDITIDQPTLLYRDGYGVSRQQIDVESQLRNETIQTAPKYRINAQARTFLTVPYMARGRGNSVLESALLQSPFSRDAKACASVTETQFDTPFIPLVPSLQQTIQDPKHIVSEVVDPHWVRGGISSRQFNKVALNPEMRR